MKFGVDVKMLVKAESEKEAREKVKSAIKSLDDEAEIDVTEVEPDEDDIPDEDEEG